MKTHLLYMDPLLVSFANESPTAIAFTNDIAVGNDGWGMLAPFGDFPGQAMLRKPDGSLSKFTAIQRLDRAAAEGMVSDFKSFWQRAKRYVTGCPIYKGHSDVPGSTDNDKTPKGTIVNLEVRDAGLFCKPIFTNEGSDLVESKKLRAFSGYWDADEIGEEAGTKIFRPTHLISAALTNRPNLPVQLLNTRETDQNTETKMKKKILLSLAAIGVTTFANIAEADVTDEQVSEAINKLGEQNKTLTSQNATLANEKTTLNGQVQTLTTEKNNLTTQLATANTNFANARQAHIDQLCEIALETGRITAADKATWEGRLKVETNFANEAKALLALPVKVKTQSVTVQINGQPVSIANAAERREVLERLVREEMGTNGNNYDKAHIAVKRKHPALFAAMPKGQLLQ